ncbi:MAG: 2-dehydro-3-deoxy-D-gluconate 5-dehydrogenase KduD [Spirochaetales bacterium]|nr:2-dehydro-3-deoxy-D-gluconate 5-dehydrogenase KduD [Spirochaetales bacterium]
MILDSFNLSGKVAIVTGSNTGLGQGICLGLAEAGAKVAGVYRNTPGDTEKMITADGGEYLGIKADLVSIEPVQRIIDETIKKFGRVDILVNNAGIIRREDSINFTEKDWDDVLNTNLKTVFFLSQAAAKQFMKQGDGGKIINIASMLSFQGGIRVPSYTSSKSGIMGLTRLLACEWAKDNINVNAIAPGYMDTNNTEALRNDPKRSAEILGRIPADRWGIPEDVAGPAVFLASSAADYVNGYTLAVDGGWLAR